MSQMQLEAKGKPIKITPEKKGQCCLYLRMKSKPPREPNSCTSMHAPKPLVVNKSSQQSQISIAHAGLQ